MPIETFRSDLQRLTEPVVMITVGHAVDTDRGTVLGMEHSVRIVVDDLSDARVASFLEEHVAAMASLSPPESKHALDLDALRQPDITFWTAWHGEELRGCGAVKELDHRHGEIKSMRSSPRHARTGIASRMLRHIVRVARERSYHRLSLETGSMEAFRPARNLYRKYGFQYCEPFAGYHEDPNSVFMTLKL